MKNPYQFFLFLLILSLTGLAQANETRPDSTTDETIKPQQVITTVDPHTGEKITIRVYSDEDCD